MRIAGILVGIVLAAVGGVVAYRAAFIAPRAAVVISESAGRVRELPDLLRIGVGLALLLTGASLAFLCARRRRPR